MSTRPTLSSLTDLDGTLPQASVDGLEAALASKAIDTEVVHKTGAETIAGAKTFSSTVTISATQLTFSGVSGKIALNASETSYLQYAANNLALVSPGTFRHAAINHLFQDPTQATNFLIVTAAGVVAPTKLYVGNTVAGSANAQFEARAASGSSNVAAFYSFSGSAAFVIGPNGEAKPPKLADSAASNESVYINSTTNKLVFKDAAGVVSPLN